MKLIAAASRAHRPADPDTFVLPGLMQPLLGRSDGERVRLYRVSFGEGGRTHWHRHDDTQLLFGLSGRCIVVDRGGRELFLGPGDLVTIGANEEHWHGAAPGGAGEHLAINLGGETTWLETSG